LPSDEELLARHIAGEPNHFEVLVKRYSGELYQFVVRFTGSRTMADDVVQETFLQVHLAASSFDPTRRFKPWLFTIAANKARDMLRSKARRPEIPLDATIRDSEDSQSFRAFLADQDSGPSERLEASEERALVRQVVDQMPANLREVLILGYFHRFPYQDIADILGIPLGTVKSRLHSAVAYFARAYRARVQKKE
jgi:RNA polymerase sigma-70 factor (ECF subfamily)